MGLFDFKKKKTLDEKPIETIKTNSISINSFRKEFIWGFTQGNPMRQSTNKDDYYKLIRPLTGENGTITIGASFHPYQIIDKTGNDIWETLFNVIKANNFCDFNDLIEKKYFFHMNTPGPQAFPVITWQDERLLYDNNPEFSKYVPFLIPYLTFENGESPEWLLKLKSGINSVGNAHGFVDSINQASRFLMPEPTFIIGFGVFDKNNRSSLIDHYVNFLEKNIKKQ